MNCPFCSSSIEKWHLDNGRRELGLMWFPETRKRPHFFFCTEGSVKKQRGALLNHAGIGASEMQIVSSWVCRNCRKGIFAWDE